MAAPGSEASRELVDVLLTLGRLRRTGILTVQGNQQIVGITFLDGRIVGTDALNESLEEGLGAVLASRDLVSAEDFASLVGEYDAGGGRVTELLLERNYIDREQLLDAQRWHCYLLCRQVLSWSDFEYKFYAGSEVAHENGIYPLEIEELLVRAAEDLGDRGPLPGTMPAAEAVFQKTDADGVEAGRDELLIGLATDGDEGASDLLQRIDGQRSVVELASELGLSEYEARLAVYLLERSGRIRLSDAGTGEFLPRVAGSAAAKASGAGALVAEVGTRLFRQGKASAAPKRLDVSSIEWNAWSARILGIGALVLLMVLGMTDHGRFLLPFPWQEGLRQSVLDEQTSAAYLKIDRAAKTSFLLNGHFPERLGELIADSYLTPRDLVDPAGRRLGYASQVAGYLIYPEDDADTAVPGAARTEAVSGNFLLDPEFVPERAVEQPPLVLLD